jgi:hypothetical protein
MPIDVQRVPLDTEPTARLNSYNHHSLAPWLAKTGYLTPLYFQRRTKALEPYYMAHCITAKVKKHMLQRPAAEIELSPHDIESLLGIAAACEYDMPKVRKFWRALEQIAAKLPDVSSTSTGYFVRTSCCSPKDVDDGNLKAVYSVRGALTKLVCSKRTVSALLEMYQRKTTIDNKVYYFPYMSLDHLSEWRCYINRGYVVAVSQSRFYLPSQRGITDQSLVVMVEQVYAIWDDIRAELSFESCVLDVYAEVTKPGFHVKLIEINPYGAHLGSVSLLFHWLDDANILRSDEATATTVVRLVEWQEHPHPPLGRSEAFQIGRANIVRDELRMLQEQGLAWVLKPNDYQDHMCTTAHKSVCSTPTTRRGALRSFGQQQSISEAAKDDADDDVKEVHPMLQKLRLALECPAESLRLRS